MTPRTLASRGALSLSGHNPLSGGPLTPRRAGTASHSIPARRAAPCAFAQTLVRRCSPRDAATSLRKSTEYPAAPSTPRMIKPAPYVNSKSPRKHYTMPASYGESKDQPSHSAPLVRSPLV